MANTYTQLYVQIIFSPKGRQNLIHDGVKTDIYKYIVGIIKNKNQKPMIINGMPDHVHIFLGFSPDIAISDLVRDIKSNTTNFINEQKMFAGKFFWQKGFGAFTYSKSQVPRVVRYIQKQEEHHRKKSFREEYLELLKKFDVDYKDEYLFEWYD
ncbi:MAG: IS200/IS605 family transposase [Bacteroidetes bacterium]|nr:IS200/IS605 family transposase [Bacteroidota bacterium]MBU1680786.1 IS200/IS605 family transposase [Bacteroidota bacterium]MBU2506481.1 IS200/IS605 family transposase [Bacteroidota bacterium]